MTSTEVELVTGGSRHVRASHLGLAAGGAQHDHRVQRAILAVAT